MMYQNNIKNWIVTTLLCSVLMFSATIVSAADQPHVLQALMEEVDTGIALINNGELGQRRAKGVDVEVVWGSIVDIRRKVDKILYFENRSYGVQNINKYYSPPCRSGERMSCNSFGHRGHGECVTHHYDIELKKLIFAVDQGGNVFMVMRDIVVMYNNDCYTTFHGLANTFHTGEPAMKEINKASEYPFRTTPFQMKFFPCVY